MRHIRMKRASNARHIRVRRASNAHLSHFFRSSFTNDACAFSCYYKTSLTCIHTLLFQNTVLSQNIKIYGENQDSLLWAKESGTFALRADSAFYITLLGSYYIDFAIVREGCTKKWKSMVFCLKGTDSLLIELILQARLTLRCLESPWGVFGLP